MPIAYSLAERSLRLAITKRKVSGASRSMERFQHTANLLTVVQTCRRQSRSVIDFFEQSLRGFRLLPALNTEGGKSHIAVDSDDLLTLSLIPISDT